MTDPPKPRITITKSRAGHYTVTAALNGIRRSVGKLSSLDRARAETETVRAQVIEITQRMGAAR